MDSKIARITINLIIISEQYTLLQIENQRFIFILKYHEKIKTRRESVNRMKTIKEENKKKTNYILFICLFTCFFLFVAPTVRKYNFIVILQIVQIS